MSERGISVGNEGTPPQVLIEKYRELQELLAREEDSLQIVLIKLATLSDSDPKLRDAASKAAKKLIRERLDDLLFDMPSELFDEICDLLSPFSHNEQARKSFVFSALGDRDVLEKIDYKGATKAFLERFIKTLYIHDREALCKVLLDLRGRTGLDKILRINAAVSQLKALGSDQVGESDVEGGEGDDEILKKVIDLLLLSSLDLRILFIHSGLDTGGFRFSGSESDVVTNVVSYLYKENKKDLVTLLQTARGMVGVNRQRIIDELIKELQK